MSHSGTRAGTLNTVTVGASRRGRPGLAAFPEMERRARRILEGKLATINGTRFDPVWLADELFRAGLIGEEERAAANDKYTPKETHRDELLKLVLGNGGKGVFQTFVNILFSKLHFHWLAEQLKG